jgi:transcriptional regulator with XRE-family HTH domain
VSYYNPVVQHTKSEIVDFIVPERIKEARIYRGLDRKEAAIKLGVTNCELGLMENGHSNIPKEFLFKLMTVYDFPQRFFYRVVWHRK